MQDVFLFCQQLHNFFLKAKHEINLLTLTAICFVCNGNPFKCILLGILLHTNAGVVLLLKRHFISRIVHIDSKRVIILAVH